MNEKNNLVDICIGLAVNSSTSEFRNNELDNEFNCFPGYYNNNEKFIFKYIFLADGYSKLKVHFDKKLILEVDVEEDIWDKEDFGDKIPSTQYHFIFDEIDEYTLQLQKLYHII